jgi:hypothetical protein
VEDLGGLGFVGEVLTIGICGREMKKREWLERWRGFTLTGLPMISEDEEIDDMADSE